MVNVKYDLGGKKYGRLKVICQSEDHIDKSGKHRSQWLCECECGNQVVVLGFNLQKGNTCSCGCLAREHRLEASTKHGDRHTRLYRIWTNIKSRCYNKRTKSYSNYGARGITMCDEWLNSYEAFKQWAYATGYNDSMSIDRIDNALGYCAENCRWANATVQAINRRSTKWVEVDGEKKTLSQWADALGYSRSIFHARAKLYGTSVEEQVAILKEEAMNKSA